MENNQTEFVLIYNCKKCRIDTAFIGQQNKIICPYCHSSSKMELVKKENLTPEFVTDRINLLADRTHENLRMAFNAMTDKEKNIVCENGNDLEKEVLLLLAKVTVFKKSVEELMLK